jgi:hypothetical protein
MTAKVQRHIKTQARTCGGVRTCGGGEEIDTEAKERRDRVDHRGGHEVEHEVAWGGVMQPDGGVEGEWITAEKGGDRGGRVGGEMEGGEERRQSTGTHRDTSTNLRRSTHLRRRRRNRHRGEGEV